MANAMSKFKRKVVRKKPVKRYVKPVRKDAIISPRTMVNLGKGFPKKLMFTHKVNYDVTLTSTSGALGNYKFWCNGMYQPNYTGGGTKQPFAFDQLAVLYDHYCVIGSKIKVTVVPATSTTAPCAYGINVNDDIYVTATDYASLAEQTQSKVNYFAPGNSDAKSITANWSAKKFFGGSILANTQLQGDVTQNPTEASFFVIYLQSLDGATTSTVYLLVEIEYIAIWKELKDLASS